MFKVLAERIDKKQDKEMCTTISGNITGDLGRGQEKFKSIEGKLDKHTEMLSSMNTSMAVMAKAMEGLEKKVCS